jgi:hypothetical protein
VIEADKPIFFEFLGDVYAFYRRDFSRFAGSVWWTAMLPFDLAAVKDAIGRHSLNPDTGHYLPMPSDVVKMLEGSTLDSALAAWSKVDGALRSVGTWASVAFDDPLIHRVVQEMGGWVAFGQKTEDEWPFIAKEFQNRYRGYRARKERPAYPPTLIGVAEAQNRREGQECQPPVLIGNPGQVTAVIAGGATLPLLTLSRPSAEALLQLQSGEKVA